MILVLLGDGRIIDHETVFVVHIFGGIRPVERTRHDLVAVGDREFIVLDLVDAMNSHRETVLFDLERNLPVAEGLDVIEEDSHFDAASLGVFNGRDDCRVVQRVHGDVQCLVGAFDHRNCVIFAATVRGKEDLCLGVRRSGDKEEKE